MRWPICIWCRRRRSGSAISAGRRAMSNASCPGWSRRWHAAQGGEAGRALGRRDGAGARLARRASAAIGRGGAAAQRLPARQLPARQRRSRADRGGARLGHVHAGRSARRSRLCAQLLGRAGRPARMARDRRDADLARRVSEPRRGDRALCRAHRLRCRRDRLAPGVRRVQARGHHPADLYPLRARPDAGPAFPALLPPRARAGRQGERSRRGRAPHEYRQNNRRSAAAGRRVARQGRPDRAGPDDGRDPCRASGAGARRSRAKRTGRRPRCS